MAYTPENNPYIPGDPYSYDLKWVVEAIKKWAKQYDSLEALYMALENDFDDLKNFVNNYFENLDISEEVNNKIDELAASGELATVIAQTIIGLASPVFVNDVSEMIDTTKIYVLLPGGDIYTYNGHNFADTGLNYISDYAKYIPVNSALDNNSDLNDMQVNGIWTLRGDYTYINSPVQVGILQAYNSDGVIFQTVTDAQSTSPDYGKAYFRAAYIINGVFTWLPWASVSPKAMTTQNASILADFNFDDLTTQGIYNKPSTINAQNDPELTAVAELISVYVIGSVIYQEITIGSGTRTGYKHVRAYYSGIWHDWATLPNINNCRDYIPQIGHVEIKENIITLTDFEYGYYDNSTGKPVAAQSYCRTKSLFKLPAGKYGVELVNRSDAHSIYLICFDSDLNYISYLNLTEGGRIFVPNLIPENCVYCGFSYNLAGDAIPAEIELRLVSADGIISFNTDSDLDSVGYGVYPYVVNSNGSFTTNLSNYKCVFIPYPAFKKMTVNETFSSQCFCRDAYGANLTPSYISNGSNGRIYTIPDGTAIVGINIKLDHISEVSFIYDNNDFYQLDKKRHSEILGKRIACIGDSITYNDGRGGANYGNIAKIIGYQKYIRDLGAEVISYGYSGLPYANIEGSNSIVNSISAEVLSDYDIVILFGGSNDERLSIPVGQTNTDYLNPNIDDTTFIGAIGKIVQQIRSQSPGAIIYICRITPSSGSNRPYSTWQTYNAAITDLAEFWGLEILDMNKAVNIKPDDPAWSTYFYDTVHPTNAGYKRLGSYIAAKINK